MKFSSAYIYDYRRLIQTTDLQKDYKEFLRFFRFLRIALSEKMKGFKFSGNIVENGMDYSYFQFSNTQFQKMGLKFVLAFVHKQFVGEIWLSGMNRKIQGKYHSLLQDNKYGYELSKDPYRVDYIIKDMLFEDVYDQEFDKLVGDIETKVQKYIQNVADLV